MTSHSEKMLEAISQDDLAEAQLQFEQALTQDSPEILNQLAEQLLGAGFLNEAKTIYTQLFQNFPDAYEMLVQLAEIAIEDGEYDEAFEKLEAIPKEAEAYLGSLVTLADLYHVLGLPEVSEVKLKEAKKLLPTEPLLDLALAELYYATDKLSEAISIYESLKQKNLDIGISLSDRLGMAYSFSGEFEEAIPYLQEAIAEEATDERQFQLAITLIQLKELEQAISILQQIRLLNPTFEALYLPLASALLDENLFEEAEEVIAEGLNQNPYNIDLYHLGSDSAYSLNNLAVAEEYLRKAVALEEDKEFSILKLSGLLYEQERYDEVVETLADLGESDIPFVYWNLAQAHNELEEYEKAGINFEKGYEGLKDEPDFLREYGLYLREEGDLSKAKQILTDYLSHVPDDIGIHNLIEYEG